MTPSAFGTRGGRAVLIAVREWPLLIESSTGYSDTSSHIPTPLTTFGDRCVCVGKRYNGEGMAVYSKQGSKHTNKTYMHTTRRLGIKRKKSKRKSKLKWQFFSLPWNKSWVEARWWWCTKLVTTNSGELGMAEMRWKIEVKRSRFIASLDIVAN